MKTTVKIQVLLLIGGVLLGVLIFLAPNQLDSDADLIDNHDHDHESHSGAENDTELETSIVLDSAIIAELAQLESTLKSADEADQLALSDSIIEFAKRNNIPPVVAEYSRFKAKLSPSVENWFMAGDNFFKAYRLSKNTSSEMIQGAIAAYEEVLKIDSNNLSAETAIGVAYVEGYSSLGVMPMKGIGILKGVLIKDPENIDALTNLGYFAIQSGQFEKAEERFNQILMIDSTHAEAYLYLADVQLSQENIEEGIKNLEKYKSLVNDPLANQQVDAYIKEIRNKIK